MSQLEITTTNGSSVTTVINYSYLFSICMYIAKYATPILVIFGVIGNILSAMIFFAKRLRKTSCSLYLGLRAVSDTGFLACLLIPWFDNVGVCVFNTVPMCQITLFLTYVCGFLSVWSVVFVTVENYFRVCRPFSVQKFCNLKWARLLILVWVIIACVIYSEALWINQVIPYGGNNVTKCLTIEKFSIVQSVVTNVDTVITLVIPSVIIFALMGSISYCIIVTYRERNANLNRGSADLQAKVTRMLFWVSFVFLVLNVPSHTIRIYFLIRGLVTSSHLVSAGEYFTQFVLQYAYYISFAINFILYVSLGDSFRKTFVKRMCPCLYALQYRSVPTQVTQLTLDNKIAGSNKTAPIVNGNSTSLLLRATNKNVECTL